MFTQPAIARIPIAPPTLPGFAIQALLSWLVFVPLFLWDRRTIGQLHWTTRLGAGLFALITIAQVFFLAAPGIWSSLAVHLPGVG
jgi:hypothetical protein